MLKIIYVDNDELLTRLVVDYQSPTNIYIYESLIIPTSYTYDHIKYMTLLDIFEFEVLK